MQEDKLKFSVVGLDIDGQFKGLDEAPLKFLGEPILIKPARKMIQGYKRKASYDPKKTFSVKFSEADIDYIKALLHLNNANGVNIYFSCYPDDGSLNPNGKDYHGRNAVILVLTRDGKDTFDVDKEPDDLTDDESAFYRAFDHGELNP